MTNKEPAPDDVEALLSRLLTDAADLALHINAGLDDWPKYHERYLVARAALLAAFARLKEERDVAEDALRHHGYRKSCDIPACNCGDQWYHGGHASERLRELSEIIRENGKTLKQAAEGMVERIAALERENADLKYKADAAELSLMSANEQVADLERENEELRFVGAGEAEDNLRLRSQLARYQWVPQGSDDIAYRKEIGPPPAEKERGNG